MDLFGNSHQLHYSSNGGTITLLKVTGVQAHTSPIWTEYISAHQRYVMGFIQEGGKKRQLVNSRFSLLK